MNFVNLNKTNSNNYLPSFPVKVIYSVFYSLKKIIYIYIYSQVACRVRQFYLGCHIWCLVYCCRNLLPKPQSIGIMIVMFAADWLLGLLFLYCHFTGRDCAGSICWSVGTAICFLLEQNSRTSLISSFRLREREKHNLMGEFSWGRRREEAASLQLAIAASTASCSRMACLGEGEDDCSATKVVQRMPEQRTG